MFTIIQKILCTAHDFKSLVVSRGISNQQDRYGYGYGYRYVLSGISPGHYTTSQNSDRLSATTHPYNLYQTSSRFGGIGAVALGSTQPKSLS